MLITSGAAAKKLGLRPLARIHTTTAVGSDPLYMLTGVIPATEKVLRRAGLTLADIDLFEVNEAFAPVVLAWAKDTGADLAKTNVNGGAIAIGHPLGASGARIMTTLVNALEQRGGRYGLQTMCEGGGMANAHHHRAARLAGPHLIRDSRTRLPGSTLRSYAVGRPLPDIHRSRTRRAPVSYSETR